MVCTKRLVYLDPGYYQSLDESLSSPKTGDINFYRDERSRMEMWEHIDEIIGLFRRNEDAGVWIVRKENIVHLCGVHQIIFPSQAHTLMLKPNSYWTWVTTHIPEISEIPFSKHMCFSFMSTSS